MTPAYVPQIIPELSPDIEDLQGDLDRNHITHLRTRRGEVWRIGSRLNRRSVPLNDASAPPSKTRVQFAQVESFGIMLDPNPGSRDGSA